MSRDVARALIVSAKGMGQATDEASDNLGFGYLYYGLTRLYQPRVVVCIGSYRGFAPVCFTLGLVENAQGMCYFIDPGKVDRYWHNPEHIAQLEHIFGLGGRLRYLRQTSQQVIAAGGLPQRIDLLFIDGDHSYDGVKFDFDHFGSRVRAGGLILLHDSIREGKGFTPWEVKRFLHAEVFGRAQYETFTLPCAAGLTLVRKLR
jgi:predicted O-methyltransferase YrrM